MISNSVTATIYITIDANPDTCIINGVTYDNIDTIDYSKGDTLTITYTTTDSFKLYYTNNLNETEEVTVSSGTGSIATSSSEWVTAINIERQDIPL